MTVTIDKIPRPSLEELISSAVRPKLGGNELVHLERFIQASTQVWHGVKDDRTMCIWGLIPPTLMDTSAYMWLHIIEPVEDFEFVLVRHSQRAIAAALEEFETIVGHCAEGNARAMRWIRWLGGEFGFPESGAVPFTIKRKEA